MALWIISHIITMYIRVRSLGLISTRITQFIVYQRNRWIRDQSGFIGLRYHYLSDLGSLNLIKITLKKRTLKRRPNDRSTSTQHIATLLGPTYRVGHPVVTSCDMAGVWKLSNFNTHTTSRYRVAKRAQNVVVTMLHSKVAIILPGIKQ